MRRDWRRGTLRPDFRRRWPTAIDSKYGCIGSSSAVVAASHRTWKTGSFVLGANSLPGADFAQAAEHCLETGRSGASISSLTSESIGLRPRGDHDAFGSRWPASEWYPEPPHPALSPGRGRNARPRIGAAAFSRCQMSSVMNGDIGCKQPQDRRRACGPKFAAPIGRVASILQPRFAHLQIETAEFVPGEIVEDPGGVGEFELLEGRRSLAS